MTKETYYVTQEKLDLIEELKKLPYPVFELTHSGRYEEVGSGFDSNGENALLRYLVGDENVAFQVKVQLYRLWRIDNEGDKVYMRFDACGTPNSTMGENDAFTAPLEEIRKHKTVSWEIEVAN